MVYTLNPIADGKSPNGVIGDDGFGTVNKVGEVSSGYFTYVFYYFVYAMYALSIVIGGVGGHMKKYPFLFFITGALLLIYCPLAFWFWNTTSTYIKGSNKYTGGCECGVRKLAA